MTDWQFELWITQTATEDYQELQRLSRQAVLSYEGSLPVNSDPRLKLRLATANHFDNIRNLLRSIRRPEDTSLDQGISGPAHFVRYRVEGGTFVYYARIVTSPPAVLIYALSNQPLDYGAIRKLVVSGNAHVLQKYGLPALALADDASGFLN